LDDSLSVGENTITVKGTQESTYTIHVEKEAPSAETEPEPKTSAEVSGRGSCRHSGVF